MSAETDPTEQLSWRITKQLLRMQRQLVAPQVSESLLPELAVDPRASVRRHAAWLLGQRRRLREPAVRSLLQQLVADRDPAVRQMAIDAVRQLLPEASPLVRTALTSTWALSSEPGVRVAAAAILARFADHPGGSTALDHLRRDPTQRVRRHAHMATV